MRIPHSRTQLLLVWSSTNNLAAKHILKFLISHKGLQDFFFKHLRPNLYLHHKCARDVTHVWVRVYRKGMADYAFPDGFKQMVLLELDSSRDAKKIAQEHAEVTIGEQQVRVQLMTQYESTYATKFADVMKASRQAGETGGVSRLIVSYLTMWLYMYV